MANNLALQEHKWLTAANMFLFGKTHKEIAESMDTDETQVKWLLSQDNIQSYIEKTSSNKELAVHLKRIEKAGDLMDSLLDKIELMLDDPEFPMHQWRDSHVALVKDVLLAKLPNTMMKTIGLAINMNFWWNKEEVVSDEALKHITKKLEPSQLILFREMIDNVGQLFLDWDVNTIQDIQALIKKSNEVTVVEDI